MPPEDGEGAPLARALVDLLLERRPGSSICPSEAARALGGDEAAWRARMPAARAHAAQLAQQGVLRLTRGGATLDPADAEALGRGPLRVRRGPKFPDTGG